MVRIERELLIEAVAQAVITVLLVAVVAYSVVARVPLSDQVMQLILLTLAAYFGFQARQSVQAFRAVRGSRRKSSG